MKNNIEKFIAGKNIKLVHRNVGIAEARNLGINQSQGEVILHLDSDCYIPNNYVEEGVKIFESNPKILTLATNYEAEYSRTLFGRVLKYYEEVMHKSSDNLFTHFVRKELYRLIGQYDDETKKDTDFKNYWKKCQWYAQKKTKIKAILAIGGWLFIWILFFKKALKQKRISNLIFLIPILIFYKITFTLR
jgi:hypothetical protein